MSRCRSCNGQFTDEEEMATNPHTELPEELCNTCLADVNELLDEMERWDEVRKND